MTGARIFVAIVFLALGLTFPVVTWQLFVEFGEAWLPLAVTYSSLFLFYPLFGTLALIAFFVPAVIFTHLYWYHVPWGRIRFAIGTAVVVALSLVITQRWIAQENWAAWTFAPQVSEAERWEPANCGEATRTACRRGPLLKHTREIWTEGQKRWGLSRFVRNCSADPMLEKPDEDLKIRHCFVAGAMLDAEQCCRAQTRFIGSVKALRDAPRSQTFEWHHMLLPFKVFFLLVLIAIGLMLAFWRRKLDDYYAPQMRRVERGLLVGAAAMLFWPLMDYAGLQATEVLYGRWRYDTMALASLLVGVMVGPWALLLLYFFLSRVSERRRTIGRLAGTGLGALAVVKFEALTDYATSFAGAGVGWTGLAGLTGVALGALALLVLLHVREVRDRPPGVR